MRWLLLIVGVVVGYEVVARIAEYQRRDTSTTEERDRVKRYVREQPPHEMYF